MKKIVLLATLILISIIIIACDGGSNNELTIFLYTENVVYDSSMPVFKAVNEAVDIKLRGYLQRYDSNYAVRFNTGGYRSDIVSYDQDTIESYGFNGTYIDLKPLIEEHAPNLRAFFEENPEKEQWATASNGAIYGIPFYADGETAKAYFIRKDWVDILRTNRLINNIPEDLNTLTVDQFESLLLAMKNNQSLLTTARDIYPYFDRSEETWVDELASLWGATLSYYVNDDGEVVFGAAEQSFRIAVENIARWMRLGLIDPNILDGAKADDRETYFARNIGGATRDWIGTTYGFNDDVYQDVLVDGFEIQAILPPLRDDNTRFEPTMRKEIQTVTAINSSVSEENRIKLIQWIDYFFSDEGKHLLNFGVKGETYNIVNENYVYTDRIINSQATPLANLYRYGAQFTTAGVQMFDYEEAWLTDGAKIAMTLYTEGGYLNQKHTDLMYPNIKLTREEYQTVNAARTQIDNELNRYLYDWIVRQTAADGINQQQWQAFTTLLNQSGANQIRTIYQRHVDNRIS